jgi:hypothetical protein
MYLINKKNQDSTYLAENRRIKVFTINGKAKAGNFRILNDSIIVVKNDTIALVSIIKIRKASAFSAITGPISIGLGSILLSGAFILFKEGGLAASFGMVLFLPGTPMFIVPFISNMHRREKWEYVIVK